MGWEIAAAIQADSLTPCVAPYTREACGGARRAGW
jgi:hypothetical protein